jgi:peptide/nickel transport system ATP-binding protein
MPVEPLLSVRNLRTYFFTYNGVIPAVDGVSFDLNRGGALGIVGESGCGKSVTALSLMRLITNPPGRIVAGEVLFEGQDLLCMSERNLRTLRGNELAIVFQEPMTALNPVYPVGYQIMEPLLFHKRLTKKAARSRALELLHMVGLPIPQEQFNLYPQQLSGGMCQRVMIAMALACNPKLLIADEPTTALDVTKQVQIIDLIHTLRQDLAMAVIIITHNLGVIAEVVDKVAVMYAGKLVEYGVVGDLFHHPLHPYTEGLLRSVPNIHIVQERLPMIDGFVPNPMRIPEGCRFHSRCRFAQSICRKQEPPLLSVNPEHTVACWLHCANRILDEVV